MRSIVLACLAVGSDAFIAPHRLGVKHGASSLELGSVAERAAPSMSEGPPMGQHGTGSKFMPLTQLDSEEYAPRTVQVAGVFPGITKAEFYAPQSAPAAPPGQWQFDFSDPEGPQMGTIAFPGSSNVQACEDPVAIVTSSAHLHISLANNVEAEVVVLIDRANTEFYDNKFFLFADAAGTTYLQWQPELPEGHEVLGRVMLVQIPFLSTMGKKTSGWMEEADDYSG